MYMKLGNKVWLQSVALATLALVACSDDPTDEGSGDAFAIVSDVSTAVRPVGASFTVTAKVVDRLGTPLPIRVTAATTKPDVVALDSSTYVPELQESRFYLRSLKVEASTPLVLTAQTLSDTVDVRVLTGPFPGTLTTAAFSGGTVLTFTNPTPLFDANTAVTVTAAETGFVVDQTPTTLRFFLPFGQPTASIPYSITGAGPADFNLSGNFNLSAPIACADRFEPNNTLSTATAGQLAPGSPVFGSLNFTTDPEDLYRVVITEAGQYRFTVDWSDAADVDMAPLTTAGGLLSAAGGTAAKPENATVTLQPGTYLGYVLMYDDAGGACTTYRLSVTKL
jgi:hypothetical protein